MIKILHMDDLDHEYITFDIDTHYINGLRRILYSKSLGSCFNQKDIAIVENNTLMNNEILRHRISLIPIKSIYDLTCELIIKNTTKKKLDVFSDDIKILKGDGEIKKNILIIQLKPKEEIHMKMNSSKYSGEKLTNYRPFSVCYFKIIKVIYLKKNFKKKINLKNLKIYKSDLDKFETIKNYEIYGFTSNLRDFVDPLINFLDKDDYIIKDGYYNNKPIYSFNIEFFFNEENFIKKGLLLLIYEIQNFLNKKIELIPNKNDKKTILKINQSDYGILNLLSKEIRNHDIIKYCAYNKEHPLDDFILLEYITFNTNKDYYNIIHNNVNNIVNYIKNIKII
jgi:DNA-directed RNA polymerase subunit L